MAKEIFAKDPEKYIPALAEAIKKIPEFQAPEWSSYVKTGMSKERPPADDNFWFTRAASILRQLYINGVVGVGRLRTRYGSRKNRGGRPGKFKKASGKIIRIILQQAEAAGLVEKMTRLQHGRRLTQKGRDFLDSIDVEKNPEPNFDEMKIKQMQMPDEIEDLEEEINESPGEEDGE